MPPSTVPAKCANPKCPTAPDANPTLLRCARCRVAQFCSGDCQKASWAEHKKNCTRPNYIIEFHLAPGKITDPPVKRTLSCPADATFAELSLNLQDAFGWNFHHSYDFAVLDPSFDLAANAFQMVQNRMAMIRDGTNMNPASARREYVMRVTHKEYRIDSMHEGMRRHPRTLEKPGAKFKLWQMFDNEEWKDLKKVYTYDFGDNWEHYMTVVGREPATWVDEFHCLAGEGHWVAEDVGGIKGWNKLKEAYAAANPTQEQRDKIKWYENDCPNSDPKGLRGDRVNFFDLGYIDRLLSGEEPVNFGTPRRG
ncbi:MM3350-like domain-containing protein [Podospora conica]|nr:MM3350-like domain-containing protein [Schizothecium conicum]